jgi:hypothetical protein
MCARMANQSITLEEGREKPLDLASYYTPMKKKNISSPSNDVSWGGVKVPSPLAKLAKMGLDALASLSPTREGTQLEKAVSFNSAEL